MPNLPALGIALKRNVLIIRIIFILRIILFSILIMNLFLILCFLIISEHNDIDVRSE